jgi:UDP-N-acetyl-2-amino-2-deoxyglucuronate dehydrogenase
MKNKKLKFGLIGLGNIGARHLQILNEIPAIELVAVADNKKELVNNFAAKQPSIPFFTNFDEVLKMDLDIVSICTPHHLHASMAIDALNSGKHVLVEKPMCLSVTDSVSMILAAEKANKRLFVVKQNRFNAPVQAVTALLATNQLGTIYQVNCQVYWNRDNKYYNESEWRGKKALEGGALYTQASHFIDLLVWWFGQIKKSTTIVQCLTHTIEIEDQGNALVQFESGLVGNISWNNNIYNSNYEGSITIIAEKGTVKIGGQYLNKFDYWQVDSVPCPIITNNILPNIYQGSYQGSSSNHTAVFEAIIQILLEGKKSNMVEGSEAIKTIASIETIYNGVA